MTKYEIVIYWSQEDGAFVAEVPELPGCMRTELHTRKPWPA
jgi:predicted RNase H-like HicB family nuclease